MAVTRYGNVIVASADGDTIAGPLFVESVKAVCGANTGNVSAKVGTTEIYESGNLSANAGAVSDVHTFRVLQGDTLTVNMSASGLKLYLYVR